jgi:hypothetical protein
MSEKNINDLLNISNYINEDYLELDINNKEIMKILTINDILVIQLLSTKNILKVFYTGQDEKYIFVCNLKENEEFISLLTNKYSFKILKENIKHIYRRSNINYNIELKFLYNLIEEQKKKIKTLETLLLDR